MNKTIKELADVLGVSKTAVRKYMTPEFRSEHVKTTENGVITIDSDGCKLVAMHLQRTEKLTETTANQFPETPETTETVLIAMLQSELDHKNEQLQVKDQQIAELNARLAEMSSALVLAQQTAQAAQALHAGTIQQQLTDGDAGDAAPDMKAQQPHWWQRIFGR